MIWLGAVPFVTRRSAITDATNFSNTSNNRYYLGVHTAYYQSIISNIHLVYALLLKPSEILHRKTSVFMPHQYSFYEPIILKVVVLSSAMDSTSL